MFFPFFQLQYSLQLCHVGILYLMMVLFHPRITVSKSISEAQCSHLWIRLLSSSLCLQSHMCYKKSPCPLMHIHYIWITQCCFLISKLYACLAFNPLWAQPQSICAGCIIRHKPKVLTGQPLAAVSLLTSSLCSTGKQVSPQSWGGRQHPRSWLLTASSSGPLATTSAPAGPTSWGWCSAGLRISSSKPSTVTDRRSSQARQNLCLICNCLR